MPKLPPAQTPNTPQLSALFEPKMPLAPSPQPDPPEPALSSQEHPAPMLDVHPAHHAATTLRDFFIHIATIVLGLFIAIGLEQTVEYFHHRHQLHQLQADLREEGLRNLHIALDDIELCEKLRRVDAAQYAEFLRAAREHRAPAPLPLPTMVDYKRPAYAVWALAQQTGTAELLERADAQRYMRLYGVAQLAVDQIPLTNSSFTKLNAAILPATTDTSTLSAFSGTRRPEQYDFSLLGPEDLRQVRNAIAEDIGTYRLGIHRNLFLYGIQWSVLHGSRSDEENLRILYDADDVYTRGGLPALLARYPLPNEPN